MDGKVATSVATLVTKLVTHGQVGVGSGWGPVSLGLGWFGVIQLET